MLVRSIKMAESGIRGWNNMKQRIWLEDGETVAALHVPGMTVHASFGPAGAWVDYDDTKPLTPFVRFLLLRRGMLNENLAGSGI